MQATVLSGLGSKAFKKRTIIALGTPPCLRSVLRICCWEHITNEEVLARGGVLRLLALLALLVPRLPGLASRRARCARRCRKRAAARRVACHAVAHCPAAQEGGVSPRAHLPCGRHDQARLGTAGAAAKRWMEAISTAVNMTAQFGVGETHPKLECSGAPW